MQSDCSLTLDLGEERNELRGDLIDLLGLVEAVGGSLAGKMGTGGSAEPLLVTAGASGSGDGAFRLGMFQEPVFNTNVK